MYTKEPKLKAFVEKWNKRNEDIEEQRAWDKLAEDLKKRKPKNVKK